MKKSLKRISGKISFGVENHALWIIRNGVKMEKVRVGVLNPVEDQIRVGVQNPVEDQILVPDDLEDHIRSQLNWRYANNE